MFHYSPHRVPQFSGITYKSQVIRGRRILSLEMPWPQLRFSPRRWKS